MPDSFTLCHKFLAGGRYASASIILSPPLFQPHLTSAAISQDSALFVTRIPPTMESFSRKNFPSDFVFGAATSAYQIEGAVKEGGRGLSIWDAFVQIPGKILDGSVPERACNFFNLFAEDTDRMQKMGMDGHRFSLSWPRIIPDTSGTVNMEGIAYYNALIDKTISAGMIPFVTLYHWDLPLALEEDPDVKGWRTKEIVKHFAHYAETCFKYFGDRVKHWITINELQSYAYQGYGAGIFAPGRCSEVSGNAGSVGDSSTEPYIVAHNSLLSHAAAVNIYRTKYQKEQKGFIGFAPYNLWCEPYSQDEEDVKAAQRYLEFLTGWQLEPIFTGDYPQSMKERVGERLPRFTPEESEGLKGSVDFLGMNYYTANFVKNIPEVHPSRRWWGNDMGAAASSVDVKGKQIGELMGPSDSWIYKYPAGLPKLLAWVEERYGRIPVYITENGTMDPDGNAPLDVVLDDKQRIGYVKEHLEELAKAIRDKNLNVRGYFLWSLLDNFEWAWGFTHRYGLLYVDFKDGESRHLKSSAHWYTAFLGHAE